MAKRKLCFLLIDLVVCSHFTTVCVRHQKTLESATFSEVLLGVCTGFTRLWTCIKDN